MAKETDQLSRRDLLKLAAQAALVATVSGCVSRTVAPQDFKIAPEDEKVVTTGPIPVRAFGRTGLQLPILGFGGAALPTTWGNPLSLDDRVKLVRYAYERGVRYFDTAGNYFESQTILGQGLQGIRHHVQLATKVQTTIPAEVRKEVEKSLKELQTDHLDFIQIHGTPGLEQMTVKQAMAIHGELVKLRDQGVVRHIGFSAHSYFDKALALIETGGFEQCLLAYGYLPRGNNQVFAARMLELRNACLAKAHEQGMAIVAMKVIGAGCLGARSGSLVPDFDKKRLRELPAAAIRYVLQDPRIHLLALGMRLQPEIDANITTLSGDTTFTTDDRALLAEYSVRVLDTELIKKMRVD